MKAIAFNGSARKDKNTATLLNKVLQGASSRGFETELIHLYDFQFKGCMSCFECKRINSSSYGKCKVKDDVMQLIEKAYDADLIVFGSPIYLADVSGVLRMFLERLLYPYLSYGKDFPSLLGKRIPVGFVYSMNLDTDMMKAEGYEKEFDIQERFLSRIYGTKIKRLICNDTYQFDDYSEYDAAGWNLKQKTESRIKQFPIYCDQAFELGNLLVDEAIEYKNKK